MARCEDSLLHILTLMALSNYCVKKTLMAKTTFNLQVTLLSLCRLGWRGTLLSSSTSSLLSRLSSGSLWAWLSVRPVRMPTVGYWPWQLGSSSILPSSIWWALFNWTYFLQYLLTNYYLAVTKFTPNCTLAPFQVLTRHMYCCYSCTP